MKRGQTCRLVQKGAVPKSTLARSAGKSIGEGAHHMTESLSAPLIKARVQRASTGRLLGVAIFLGAKDISPYISDGDTHVVIEKVPSKGELSLEVAGVGK